MKTIEFYCVITDYKAFFVNTDSEEKARKLVEEDYGLEVLCCKIVDLIPDLCCEVENIFM